MIAKLVRLIVYALAALAAAAVVLLLWVVASVRADRPET